MKNILILGLTGKTGSGKTTLGQYLKEKGCYIIDGDIIARKITEKGSETLKDLAKEFGSDIIDDRGCLKRKLLAQKAFSSPQNTEKLNSITHPAIYKIFLEEIEEAEAKGYKTAVIDAAALLESECKSLCEKIIIVTAPEDIRLKRILSRDGITEEEAMIRIKAQKSDEYYFSNGDIIIRNFPPYDETKEDYTALEELIP